MCASSCPPHYYFEVNSGLCSTCSSNCTLCFGSILCTACADIFFLFNSSSSAGLCVLQNDCILGTYGNSTSKTCASCPYDCWTCINSTNCSSCNDTLHHRTLDPNISRCVPLPGFYDTGIPVTSPCLLPCTECLSATFCTACNFVTYLTKNNTCIQKCLQQLTFYGQPRPTCETCPYDCLTCNIYG